jgi:leucine dehydrogenase
MIYEGSEKFPEFDAHKLVYPIHDEKSGLKAYIAIHRGGLTNPSFGATRFSSYETETDALRDALRLSRLMSYKSALAGFKYGGAKGVILDSANGASGRKNMLRSYAEHLNRLSGRFVTGTDAGLTQEDIVHMRKFTPHLVGFKTNPAFFTGQGLFHSLKVSLAELFGRDGLSGRSFAVQGLGKIGTEITRLIHAEGGNIFVTDTDPRKVGEILKEFPGVKAFSPDQIVNQSVDVYVPCAMGAITVRTAKSLKCKAVVGGANNQLENEEAGDELYRQGILYAPDYVANSGGLISVISEFEDKPFSNELVIDRVKKIGTTMKEIISKSRSEKRPTNRIANAMAEKAFEKFA